MNTIKTISTWTSLILHFLSNSMVPGGKIFADDFFFATDVRMSPAEVIGCYADRWAIEDTFKNTKQYLSGQQLQTFKGQGPERAAGLSLWLYSMVWLWYLKQKSSQQYFMVHPRNPLKCRPSFADAIACPRRELWRERIMRSILRKCMFGNSAVHGKKFEFLLEALAPAAQSSTKSHNMPSCQHSDGYKHSTVQQQSCSRSKKHVQLARKA